MLSLIEIKNGKVIKSDPRAHLLVQKEEIEILKLLPKAERLSVASGTTCEDELGCFPLDAFYHPIYRPFNLIPFDRKRINTTYSLYTRANPKERQILKAHDSVALRKSYFNANKDTKIIIHGFLEHWILNPIWIQHMRDEFLIHGDYNIIVVDWKGGNNFPYSQAVSNTRIVGAEVALFIHFLMVITKFSYASN
ncbi:pancreatic triacylglycerol lipase-like protein [Leptotrombidium deliense]|uniref:Pancreatic triacylglycerol lipase-like protein n=1 Tax=Leptotrombidium deliense TaxID=299467 RepID=A0A443S553_9ACAR|nr:pancreatic triacylglycerol lipase-like protein [Leptotrombidium deliense]